MTPLAFTPPRWLRNPHLQTLWPKFFRTRPALPLRRERVELTDGDYETAAGFVLDQLGRLARVGDEIVVGSVTFRVAVVEGRRILALDVIPQNSDPGD